MLVHNLKRPPIAQDIHLEHSAEPTVHVHIHEIVGCLTYLADTSTYHHPEHLPVPKMKSETGNVERCRS